MRRRNRLFHNHMRVGLQAIADNLHVSMSRREHVHDLRPKFIEHLPVIAISSPSRKSLGREFAKRLRPLTHGRQFNPLPS